MTTDLCRLLLIPGGGHARLEVARGALSIALSQSQHILHLNILQILLDDCLRLLLVIAGREARIQKLL